MQKLQLYVVDGCPYCRNVELQLLENGIDYDKIQANFGTEIRSKINQLSGILTVPQAFLDGEFLGDSQTFMAAYDKRRAQ